MSQPSSLEDQLAEMITEEYILRIRKIGIDLSVACQKILRKTVCDTATAFTLSHKPTPTPHETL